MTDNPILNDFDRRIAALEKRLDFRPAWERPENVRLLAKTRQERDRWVADNSSPDVAPADPAVDSAEAIDHV